MRTRSTVRGLPIILGAFTVIAGAPEHAEAQTRSLTWTETTRMEVPGALGTVLRVTGVTAPRESQQRMHLQGRSLIQEDDDAAVIIDLENGRFVTLDHASQSYFSMSFDETAALAQGALSDARAAAQSTSREDRQAAREEMRRTLDEAEATLDMRVNAESTGRTRSFGSGINATQHFVITEFEATAVPEGVDESESVGGSIVLLTEMWQTDDVPTSDEFMQSWAQEFAGNDQIASLGMESAETGEALAEGLAAWDPRIAAGLRRMGEAMSEIRGTTIQSTITVAMVPQGVTLDREELIAWEPESMGGQLRSQAASAVRGAAAQAARGAIGSLFGRRGGQSQQQEPEPAAEEAPSVRPLMRIITTRENIQLRESADDVLGTLEARMANYREMNIQQ